MRQRRWYPVNSVIPEDCIPDLRFPGGGVSEQYMFDTYREAADVCIARLENRIRACQSMIRNLKRKAQDETV
jgi:hypothetical protein